MQRGVTLVELMLTVAILVLLLAAAMPNFGPWIAGTRVRSTAESMLAGLQYAKSEATTRNTLVRFQLTTSLDATCALSVNGANWVVDVVDAVAANDGVAGQCNATPSDTVAPSILQVRAATETGQGTAVASTATQVVFNGLSQQQAVAGVPAAAVSVDIRPTNAAQCVSEGGKVTCLRVIVSPAGLVRMCNPTAPAEDPQAC